MTRGCCKRSGDVWRRKQKKTEEAHKNCRAVLERPPNFGNPRQTILLTAKFGFLLNKSFYIICYITFNIDNKHFTIFYIYSYKTKLAVLDGIFLFSKTTKTFLSNNTVYAEISLDSINPKCGNRFWSTQRKWIANKWITY